MYDQLGQTLAAIYSAKLPAVSVFAQGTSGSLFNAASIQQGNADLGFVQADIAYLRSKRGSATEGARLRGMAVLYVNTVQIFVRDDSTIRRVSDLRGRRVAVGEPGSPTEVAARVIVESHGLSFSEVDFRSLNDSSLDAVASQILDRSLDAGIFVTSYPVVPIVEIAKKIDVRLIPLESPALKLIRSRYPFYKPVTIPSGTYRDQARDIATIGIDSLLVCREGLSEDLVYQLTKTFFESLPQLSRTHPATGRIDVEQGPATSIPLHVGAARYYRERELRR